jgi:hypothetical protein
MSWLPSLLTVTHLIGLALAIGSATVKLMLLFKCKSNRDFIQNYIGVARPITKILILGIVLLTLSGIGWLLLGYPFTPVLILKLALVGLIWILGPIIDNVVEPKFHSLAPQPGSTVTPQYLIIERKYLLFEVMATTLFYIIVIMWVTA